MSDTSTKNQASKPVFDPSTISRSSENGQETVSVDMEAFRYMNSETVRDAILWFQELQEEFPKMQIRLRHVHPAVVRLLLVVRSTLPRQLRITSGYVPYFCDACSTDDDHKCVTADSLTSSASIKTLVENAPKCTECGLPMHADFEEIYFSLFENQSS